MSCPCRALCFTPKAGCPSVAARALEGPLPRAMSVARTIHQMPLFAGLEPDMLQRLMADVALVRQPAGTLLFSDGTDADCFYVVLSGQVKLFALLPDGRESVIEVIGAVSSFGEAAMLAGTGFPVNAEILEDSELLRVGRRAFVATLRSDHALAYRMLSALCGWQQRLTGEARLLRGQQAWLRVAAYLLSFTAGRSGRADIRLPFSKEVLASRIGIRRESLSRVLNRLRILGVTSSGSMVTIGDVDGLRHACAQASLPQK